MIAWFARNGVAANLLAIVLIVAGIGSVLTIKVELFPSFSLDTITVTVPFRGATPAEVEEQVIKRIEDRIQDVEGIDKLTARANEGSGTVIAEISKGYEPRQVLDDIQSRVDAIDTFPTETERPIVQEALIKREVLGIAIFGDADERTLKELAERTRDRLLLLPGITQIDINTTRNYEISIEVSELALRKYNLTFSQIANAVRNNSIDFPGGQIKTLGGEILLRTKGQAYRQADFEAIPLLTNHDGTRITIGDVATVVDGFEDEVLVTTFNGKPSVGMTVFEVGDQNPLQIADAVKAFVDEEQANLPPGIQISEWRDITYYLWGRLNMLINNAIIGFALVLLVLGLFLRPSLAFWVTLGIPISFLGTFIVMPWLGTSVNLISLFGFILVLGIVVDDAIVVGESVFSEFQHSKPDDYSKRIAAAIRGTHEVSVPVTFAVLTTAIAFTPLLNLPGFQGKFLSAIPMVVIPTLLFSLIESKLVLPYHLSLCRVGQGRDSSQLDIISRIQRPFANGLEWFVQSVFRPHLEFAMRHRYATLAAFFSTLIITLALIGAGIVKWVPFPPVPSDYIFVNIIYPEGTPVEVTRAGHQRVIDALDEIVAENIEAGRGTPIDHRSTVLGTTIRGGGPAGSNQSGVQSHLATVVVELKKSENRATVDGAVELANRWRKKVGQLPGIKALTFDAQAAGGQGEPVDIQITSPKLDDLRPIANAIKTKLGEYEGLFDIRDNLSDSQKEIQLSLKPSAEPLGLTLADLGRQVRAAFFGEEAQRIQRGRDDVRVMIRYPAEDRRSTANLENLRIRLPDGREVPFSEVAEVQFGTGYAGIQREDRRRIANVTSDADKATADLTAVKRELNNTILPEIMAAFPGASYRFAGESEEAAEGNAALISGALVVLIAMYAMLAIPFKSYTQPLIVMIAIPFGLVGAIGGHLIMSRPISTLSVYGIMALTGVVVNDSLVLVDYINRRVRSGEPLIVAVREAGVRRFRPILLTSLTTFCGLMPILLERSLQAQFLIPMAISLSFGIVFATAITLLLVPTCYLILNDFASAISAAFRWMNQPLMSSNAQGEPQLNLDRR